jgi:hypothetical protein
MIAADRKLGPLLPRSVAAEKGFLQHLDGAVGSMAWFFTNHPKIIIRDKASTFRAGQFFASTALCCGETVFRHLCRRWVIILRCLKGPVYQDNEFTRK